MTMSERNGAETLREVSQEILQCAAPEES